jgi:hypothetical protein
MHWCDVYLFNFARSGFLPPVMMRRKQNRRGDGHDSRKKVVSERSRAFTAVTKHGFEAY